MAKGALTGLSLAALSVAAAAGYYASARPGEDKGLLRTMLKMMASIAMQDPLGGAGALAGARLVAAFVAGAILGRYAARLDRDAPRREKMIRATALAYLGSAVAVATALGIVRSLISSHVECIPCIAAYSVVGGIV